MYKQKFNSYFNRIVAALVGLKYRLKEPVLLYFARKASQGVRVKEENPRVSIIVATYNRSKILLERTLPSLLAQTYVNIEVVIVGDKCIDDTASLLKDYPDGRVIFYDLAERGKYPNHIRDRWFVQGTAPRNKGMEIATGDWFCFISDDDILLPHHIETLLKAAILQGVEFISASYEAIKDGKKITVHPVNIDPSEPGFLVGGMQTWLYRSYLKVFEWNIHAWRKSVNRPADYDLQERFFRAGVRMGHITEVVAFIPPVEGTNTTGYRAAKMADPGL